MRAAVLLAGCIGLVLLRYPGLRVLDETRLGFDATAEAEGPPDVHGADLDTAAHLIVESLDDGLLLEANDFGLLAATEDAREGTAAFLEKRPAKFQGR